MPRARIVVPARGERKGWAWQWVRAFPGRGYSWFWPTLATCVNFARIVAARIFFFFFLYLRDLFLCFLTGRDRRGIDFFFCGMDLIFIARFSIPRNRSILYFHDDELLHSELLRVTRCLLWRKFGWLTYNERAPRTVTLLIFGRADLLFFHVFVGFPCSLSRHLVRTT